MRSMHTILPQWRYQEFMRETENWVSNAWKASLSKDDLTKLEHFKSNRPSMSTVGKDGGMSVEALMNESLQRRLFAKGMMINMIKQHQAGKLVLNKAGVTTSLGYNFYDLRAPVFLLYPVNVPFRNSIARVGRVNDGVGVAAHWQATRNVGSLYAGVVEGQRGPTATPDDNPYVASYKELGIERAATFTSQFAGEGYTDNLADEHLRGLHELWLQDEGIILNGNSGTATGNNGFVLTTAPTPNVALQAGTGLTTGTYISV